MSSQHEKGSLSAFDQVKVKYPSSKSDSRNSLIIDGLSGALHRGKNLSELFDQVKLTQRPMANPKPCRQVLSLQRMSACHSRYRPPSGSLVLARFAPSRSDAADRRQCANPELGITCSSLGVWAALDQVQVKYRSSKSDLRESLILNSLPEAF